MNFAGSCGSSRKNIHSPRPSDVSAIIQHIFLLFVLLSHACFAQAGAPSTQARLIGEWQLGLNSENRTEPAIENMSLGLLGPVWRFSADQTFVIYFPCNLDIPLKLKDVVARGRWEISAGNKLQISITDRGDWRGGQNETHDISFSSGKGKLETVSFAGINAGRFDRALVNCGKSTEHLRSR